MPAQPEIKRRGRPVKYVRPKHCRHKPRPEHANNKCYACSSAAAGRPITKRNVK